MLLTARAAQDVFTRAINNDGLIQARRIENEGGVVRLSGGAGTTINTGTLDASGDTASDGGSIHVTGNYVGLAADATLTADGGQNGGPEKHDLTCRDAGSLESKKQNGPQTVEDELNCKQD